MKNDGKPAAKDDTDPVEGRVVNHPEASKSGNDTDVPPASRS
jgi:sec-independent protein translocase protein TatA